MAINPESYDIDYWKNFDSKELNRQMTPIYWIKNKDKRETANNHIQVSILETKRARETVPCTLDISYGPHELQKIDIYGTDLPSDAPVFFWLHGGYWRSGGRSDSALAVKTVHSWGVKSVVVDFPLAPEVGLAEICSSVCLALQKAMIMLPKSTFILGGHSAGAQLVSSVFHKIPNVKKLPESLMERVRGAFLISGPYDLRPVIHMPSINKDLKLKEDEAVAFSAILTVDKIHSEWNSNKLKFCITIGENDAPGVQRPSVIYADMLRKKQLYVEFWHAKNEDHFTIIETLSDPNSPVSRKLKEFLLTVDISSKKSKM